MVRSYFNALSVIAFVFFPCKTFSNSSLICSSLDGLSKPLLRILKISLSPSSPYFPINVSRFSMAGVSNGSKPYNSKTFFMVLKIYWRLRTTSGSKSRVPCGREGFLPPSPEGELLDILYNLNIVLQYKCATQQELNRITTAGYIIV